MVCQTDSKPFGIRKHPAKEFLKNFKNRPLKTASKFGELKRKQKTMKYWSQDLKEKLQKVEFLYGMDPNKVDDKPKDHFKAPVLSTAFDNLMSGLNGQGPQKDFSQHQK